MSQNRRYLGAWVVALLLGTSAQADEEYGGRRATPRNAADLCEVADSNLQRATSAILAMAAKSPTSPTPSSSSFARWDHQQQPKYLDQFERRFTLRASERERLFSQGFASLSRLTFPSYASALHELYQSQLPLYVSVDSILHAVYASNDKLVADIERQLVLPRLAKTVQGLRSGLKGAQTHYPAETVRDLDLYLTVAARLLGDTTPPLVPATDGEAAGLLSAAKQGKELLQVPLFGRPRMIDFSQYTPRGHYVEDPQLGALFQSAMWLSRLELNLVSRSSRSSAPGTTPDPRETPRESVLALALADLTERSGVLTEINTLDRVWSVLAGRREDVSLAELTALRKQAGIADLRTPDVADKLRAVIGNRYSRTIALHYMPQGSSQLPVISTLLGPRVVADAMSMGPLVHDAVPERYRLGVAELAYSLGNDRALTHLTTDLQRFPTLRTQLDKARTVLSAALHPSVPATDLYSAWLRAVQNLSSTPQGVRPSYMDEPAYSDLRMNSVVAAFGQIKHNYVLLAGQAYDMGGCAIPDGYVEPAAATYDALIEYAQRGERILSELDPSDVTAGLSYFHRLGRLLKVLRVIAEDELSGRPLSVEQKRFLSMVVEMSPGSSGGPPTYTGWYFDLFRQRQNEGLATSQFIADFYTSTNLNEAAYVGVSAVRLGVFVVDVGGSPRIMTGPIARAFEHHRPFGPGVPRLNDETAASLTTEEQHDPWAKSYTVAPPQDITPVTVTYDPDTSPAITVEAEVALRDVTFALLDHHRQPLATLRRSFPAGKTVFRIPARSPTGKVLTASQIGGISLRQGEFFHAAEVQRAGMGMGVFFTLGKRK